MQCDIRIRFNDAWISLRFNHTARAQCARTHRIDGIRGGLFLSHRLLWKIEWSHFECNIVICHSIFIIISIIPFSNGVIIIKFVLFFFFLKRKKKEQRNEVKRNSKMKWSKRNLDLFLKICLVCWFGVKEENKKGPRTGSFSLFRSFCSHAFESSYNYKMHRSKDNAFGTK